MVIRSCLHTTMPIQLPEPLEGIDLPDAPEDPPTLDDVVRAKLYKAQVDVAFGQPLPP
jgi:hypothetical protein